MKKEYDFSKAVKGKFYRHDIRLDLPIYLDTRIARFIQNLARRKKADRQTIVNELLRKEMAHPTT
jgi:hypothetical protein